MKVIYPLMVESMYAAMTQAGHWVERDDLYREMLEMNLIDENGDPSQQTIEEGQVKTFVAVPGTENVKSTAEFMQQFPAFAEFGEQHFAWTGSVWGVDMYVLETLAWRTLADPDSSQRQRRRARDILNLVAKIQREEGQP